MNDIYSRKDLLKLINVKQQTLNLYLCRSDFSHIKQFFKGKHLYYYNLSLKDIEKLKQLAERKKPKKDLQTQIIDYYGYENQLQKLIEELRELEQVIIYNPQNEEHLKEEMADVLNLIEQIIKNKRWVRDIENIKNFKIDRQLTRIDNERASNTRNMQSKKRTRN